MVEGGGLENRCARNGTGGSNPSPSANEAASRGFDPATDPASKGTPPAVGNDGRSPAVTRPPAVGNAAWRAAFIPPPPPVHASKPGILHVLDEAF